MSEKNPAVVAAISKMEQKFRPQKYYFYGDECKDMECKPVTQFQGIITLLDLFAVLEQCWSKETAYPSCQKEWVQNDPSYGQCAKAYRSDGFFPIYRLAKAKVGDY